MQSLTLHGSKLHRPNEYFYRFVKAIMLGSKRCDILVNLSHYYLSKLCSVEAEQAGVALNL
jgi:hypothetical protein